MGTVDPHHNAAHVGKAVIQPSLSALLSRDFSPCGTESIRIRLPVGLADRDGKLVREVRVEPLDGLAEISSESAARNAGFIGWVTAVISHTARPDGNFSDEHPAARLSVADRDMLVLVLRMLTFGPEIWGIVQCPGGDCGSRLDVSYDLTNVKAPSGSGSGRTHAAEVECGAKRIGFTFREPDGLDQEAVAELAHSDPRQAREKLISRCLIDADGIPDTSAGTIAELPEEVLDGIDSAISKGMTSFDWDLEITCPECGKPFTATLDIQEFFWAELQMTREDFWNEVHQLAFYYHWPESEILALPRWRRKMYLNLIRRHISAAANA